MTVPMKGSGRTGQAPYLRMAARNAGALWTALGTTRGHELVRRPGFLGVHGCSRAGTHAVLTSAAPDSGDLAELTALIRRRSGGRLAVDDPFGSVDLTHLGLAPRRLPVMVRRPGLAVPPPNMPVTRVATVEDLRTVERVVVHGFPLARFQPYRAGEALPLGLLDYPEVELFLAWREDQPVGACVALVDDDAAGLYWVTTLPEHRARGVGRALMHSVLGHLAGLPVTLTASQAGKPLYDSLGFQTIADLTRWL